jgi:two-component system alkaline phosphatase synthesis response regulator PhoP
VLVVEDDATLAEVVGIYLGRAGFTVEHVTDGEHALVACAGRRPDLVVLDLMLPGVDGREVCRRLRAAGPTPVIILTALGSVADRVLGLELGADDYVTKPFDMMELLARIEAKLRRTPVSARPADGYQFGGIAIDFRKAEVTRDGQPIELAAREFQLLRYFIEHRGATLTREELLNEVWGYNAMPSTRTVDVHVAWLRQKLEPVVKHPQYILTVHGLGYKFAG